MSLASVLMVPAKDGGFAIYAENLYRREGMYHGHELLFSGSLDECLKYLAATYTPKFVVDPSTVIIG